MAHRKLFFEHDTSILCEDKAFSAPPLPDPVGEFEKFEACGLPVAGRFLVECPAYEMGGVLRERHLMTADPDRPLSPLLFPKDASYGAVCTHCHIFVYQLKKPVSIDCKEVV